MDVLIFKGNIVHCSKPFQVDVVENGCLVVRSNKIIHIGNESMFQKQKDDYPTAKVVNMKSSQILIPGLIDTHIHAPQYPNAGLGYDKTLLDWLMSYTYPTETLYSDLEFSKTVYDAIVKKTISYGTTTAAYFGTLYRSSTMELVESVLKHGQRAFVGKVNMITFAPKNYMEDSKTSIAETKQFISDVLSRNNELVKPIITPRFALSVDTNLMLELAELAKKYDLNIQSHISENKDEIEKVFDAYGKGYAKTYDDANMLTNKTIMAHGVHLTDDELQLLSCRGTSVSHCPASNTQLRSGLCDVGRLIKAGIKVGLGTDVSGGPTPSIISAMRSAIEVSIHVSFQQNESASLKYTDAFYLATMGGAIALSLDEKIGNFVVGKEFDALLVDMNVKDSSIDYLKECTPLELLQKFVCVGDDRNIINVFVNGKKVKSLS